VAASLFQGPARLELDPLPATAKILPGCGISNCHMPASQNARIVRSWPDRSNPCFRRKEYAFPVLSTVSRAVTPRSCCGSRWRGRGAQTKAAVRFLWINKNSARSGPVSRGRRGPKSSRIRGEIHAVPHYVAVTNRQASPVPTQMMLGSEGKPPAIAPIARRAL